MVTGNTSDWLNVARKHIVTFLDYKYNLVKLVPDIVEHGGRHWLKISADLALLYYCDINGIKYPTTEGRKGRIIPDIDETSELMKLIENSRNKDIFKDLYPLLDEMSKEEWGLGMSQEAENELLPIVVRIIRSLEAFRDEHCDDYEGEGKDESYAEKRN